MPAPKKPQLPSVTPPKDSPKLNQALHTALKTDGGFSVDQQGNSPKVGYMVSLPGTEQQIRSQNVTPGHIGEFIKKNGKALSRQGAHVGGWDNKETGNTSLDVSQNVKPKPTVTKEFGSKVANADALTSTEDLMVGRNQEAAYDVKADKDVPNKHFKGRSDR